MLSDTGGGELTSILDVQSCFSIIKENWICTMTRYHANNILSARNLPFASDVRQRSHTLMIPLLCLWAKSNNRKRGHFEYDAALFIFLFLFDFVHSSHARWGCCSIVCLRFQAMQIKQVDCKMSTKKSFIKRTFRDIFGHLHTEECKAMKK